MAYGIAYNLTQVPNTNTVEIVITGAETNTQNLNITTPSLKAEFFLDEGLTNKIGEVSPINTPFFYERTDSSDYSLWIFVQGPTDTVVEQVDVTVVDYKPIFTLTNYSNKNLNEETHLSIASLIINEADVCEDNLDTQVQWKIYFKDNLIETQTIDFDPADYTLSELDCIYTFENVGKYLIVCTVQNCNGSTSNSYELLVTGSIRVRKIQCGLYRVYNTTIEDISHIITDMEDNPITQGIIPALSFIEVSLTDGVYKLISGEFIQFIFSWCTIESCMDTLLQEFLFADCKKCEDKKQDPAVKMVALYNVYKKIVDTNEKYDIVYRNIDAEGVIASMYEANEIAKKLLSYCQTCKPKSCGC